MIGFEDYARIKNNYCICYFGQCNEYLAMMELLRPKIEAAFPGMNFCISCKDDCVNLFQSKDKVLSLSELKLRKQEFAHIKELKLQTEIHPVYDLLINSGIENLTVRSGFEESTTKAVIITHNTYPTNPMNTRQIEVATKIATSRGFDVEVSNDWKNAGLVIGVESPELVYAGAKGIPVILVDSGIGTKLFKMMFPDIEILS